MPVAPGAKIGAVEIARQDFLFAEFQLQPKGDNELLYFSFYRAVAVEVLQLDELLGDRAAALYNRTSFEVSNERPSDASDIDTEMIHEPPILN